MIDRPLSLILAPGVASLIAAALVVATGSASWAPPPPIAPDLGVVEVSGKGVAVLPDYREQSLRPLLNLTRRPEPRACAESAADAGAFAQLELRGIFAAGVAGGKGGVIVRNRTTNQVRRVAVGESVEGWRLDALKTSEAVFSSAEGSRELKLARQPQAQGASQPQAQGASQPQAQPSARNGRPRPAPAQAVPPAGSGS